MLGFQLCHVRKEAGLAPVAGPENGPAFLFETCLRKIWILPEGASEGPGLLQGIQAYSFLLEVISGYHSPLFGETEILGQFKKFLEQNHSAAEFGFFKPWAQQLLEDTKELRTKFLRGHGQNSYGSLLRKSLAGGEDLWVLGAGQLAQSLLPWLSEQRVTLWVREPALVRGRFPGVAVEGLHRSAPSTSLLVVAAPLSEEELAPLLARHGGEWIDLREKNLSPSLPPARLTLADLFRKNQSHRAHQDQLRRTVAVRILEMSEARINRAWFRPQGWEDVCAS